MVFNDESLAPPWIPPAAGLANREERKVIIVQRPKPPGGGLWTPSAITPATWHDASDLSNIIISGSMSQLSDKSANGRHFLQATAVNRPAVSTINGISCIDFNGTSHAMDSVNLSTSWAIAQPFSVVLIATASSVPGSLNYLLDNSGRVVLGIGNTSTSRFSVSAPVGWLSSGANLTANVPFIASAVFDGENSLIALNGAAPVAGTAISSSITTNVRLGRNTGSLVSFWRGKFGEMVILAGRDANVLSRVVGYMAHKWGIAGSLDAGFVYRTSPPTL